MDKAVIDRWIDDARGGSLDDGRIAELARLLAASGTRLPAPRPTADLASTGGPGSLSTLIAPLALASYGLKVPKLGVPGRPAGGVDVLQQIPGYSARLDRSEALKVLQDCGYVHLEAGEIYAPADAQMFARRQQRGAQALPELAIASLLSKKIAMGVDTVGLEVRVGPHGNFGADRNSARSNADQFCRVARLCSIDATCFITDGRIAQQPYIGRGEALLAMALLLRSDANDWLAAHASDCLEWSATLADRSVAPMGRIAEMFGANVVAQGGSVAGFEARANEVASRHTRMMHARSSGWLRHDLGRLRAAIMSTRDGAQPSTLSDPAGVVLLVRSGARVEVGTAIASVRCSDEIWHSFGPAVSDSMILTAEPWLTEHGALEVVSV